MKIILTRSSVLQGEVLVLELVAIDGLSTSTVSSSEVSTLAHEVGDHTVEGGALEAEPLLTGAQSAEVLTGLWYNIGPQLKCSIINKLEIMAERRKQLRTPAGKTPFRA